jgi:hypothetical protein
MSATPHFRPPSNFFDSGEHRDVASAGMVVATLASIAAAAARVPGVR